MKANKEKFEPRSTRWKESRDGFEFIRKGAVGDHASLFTPALQAEFDDALRRRFPGGEPPALPPRPALSAA